ncbi:MAG: NAD(P)/FAD-dependent oxidoreductase [Spirochaetales bacterium]|nr:NAD(P)/FAD-dependent oxidoreductase [Spirochaetales bacterium]
MKNIIIIGSGIGGLAAGNLLAKNGHKVTIFESNSTPGGYVGGFKRKNFYFESGIHSFLMSGSIFKFLKKIDVQDKVQFIKQESFRFISSDFDAVIGSYEDFKSMLFNAYPKENSNLRKYFQAMDSMYAIYPILFSNNFSVKKIIYALKFLLLFMQYGNCTIDSFIKRYFSKNSPVYRFFRSFVIYPDQIVPITAGGFWFLFKDHWTVRGGMQTFTNVIIDKFISRGGILKLRSSVNNILVKNNRAIGVMSNDVEYKADIVISACDYKETFLKLIATNTVSKVFLDKVTVSKVCRSFFVVYIGLSIPNETLHAIMKTVQIQCYDVYADNNDIDGKEYFNHCKFYMDSPSLENHNLAPHGKSSIMIHTPASYNWMNTWGNGNQEDYRKLKNSVTEILIERASVIIPDLTHYIEYKDAATPLTFERYTSNSNGATNAWSWKPNEKYYNSPISAHVVTPIKNLLIGSSWAVQLGGVPYAIKAGEMCAKIIGKD